MIDSMIASGATIEEVGKALAHSGVLSAVGDSPESVARNLLGVMRSSEDVTAETLAKALERGGVDMEAAQKAVLFQKALGACGADPEDVAKALLLQKALVNAGMPATVAAKLMREITSKGKLTEEEAAAMLREMSEGELDYDDVMRGLKLDKTLAGPEGVDIELVKEVMKTLGKNPTKEALSEAANKLASSFGIDAKAASSAAALQKVMAELGLEASDVSKILAVQKKMYESGASPQDIAVVFQTALDSGDEDGDDCMSPEESRRREEMIQALTATVLNAGLSASDVAAGSDLAASSQLQGLPEEVVKSVALMQKTIEVGLKSPEKSAKEAAAKIRAGATSETEVCNIVKDLLEENGLDADALAEGVLLQKTMAALGVKPEDFAAVMKLQDGLLKSGKSKSDVSQVLEILASKGSNLKDAAESLINSLESGGRLKDEDMQNFSGLLDALEGTGLADDKVMQKLKQDLAGAKTKAGMVEALEKALGSMGVTPEALSKVMLVQKVMSDAGAKASPEDLAKLCRVQKALLDAGVPTGAIPRAVASILEEDKKASSPADKAKARLKDVRKTGKVDLKVDALEFGEKFKQAADPANQHSEEDVRRVLEAGADAAGLTGDDLARAMLVQKTLAATGVTPEALSQLMLLQKTLASSGKSPEEIAQFLSDAAGGGLSEEAINQIMSDAMSNPNLTPEDVENMMKLQDSLQKGFVKSSGVSPESMGQILKLQSTLENSGLSPEQVSSLMNKITTGDTSSKELNEVIACVLGGKSVDKALVEDIMSGQSALQDSSLQGLNVDASALKQLGNLQEKLRATGATPDEIKTVLEMVSSGSLEESEVKDLMKSIAKKEKPVSLLQKKAVADVEAILKSDRLKSSGLEEEAVDALLTLSNALSISGKTDKEVQKILSDITSGALSDSQINKLVNELSDSKDLSSVLKEKLPQLAQTLKSNSIKIQSEHDKKALDDIVVLAKTLQSSGESIEDVKKLVKKAMKSSLNQSEVNSVVDKIKSNHLANSGMEKLSEKDKRIIAEIKDTLTSDRLKKSNLKEDTVNSLLTLTDALNCLGKTDEEIKEILSSITDGSISTNDLKELISDLSTNDQIPTSLKNKVPDLVNAMKSNSLKIDSKKDKEVLDEVLTLAKVLKSSGEVSDNVKKLVKKAMTEGLNDLEVKGIVDQVQRMASKDITEGNAVKDKVLSDVESILKSDKLRNSDLNENVIDTMLTLHDALANSGKSEEEINQIISDLTKGTMSSKKKNELMTELSNCKQLPKHLAEKMPKLIESLQSTDLKIKSGEDQETLNEILTLSKTLQESGESAENVRNIVKKAMSEGLTDSEVAKVAEKLVKGQSMSSDKFKDLSTIEGKIVSDIEAALKCNKLKASGLQEDMVDTLLTLRDALTSAGKSEDDVQQILSDLTKGEISKEHLDTLVKDISDCKNMSKHLKEKLPGLVNALRSDSLKLENKKDQEALEEVLFLAKALQSTGESTDNVKNLIKKALTDGLTSSEVTNVVEKLKGKPLPNKIMEEKLRKDIDKIKSLGISEGTAESLVTLTSALVEAGKSDLEMEKIMTQIANGALSDKEIDNLINELAESDKVPSDIKNKLGKIRKELKSDCLRATDSDCKEGFSEIVALTKALKKSGDNHESISRLLTKAVREGLTNEELKAVVEKTSGTEISLDLIEDRLAQDLENLLLSGKMKSLKPEKVDQLITLHNALDKVGMTEDEIKDLMAKVASGELTESEANKLLSQLASSSKLSEDIKQKLPELAKALKSNSLKIDDSNDKELIDDVVLLVKALKSSGEKEEDIDKLLKKAMTDGLTKAELAKTVSKVKNGVSSSSFELSKDDVMGTVKKALLSSNDKLSKTNVNKEQLNSLLDLSEALSDAGHSSEKVSSIVQKVAEGNLTKQEREHVIKELSEMASAAREAGNFDAAKKLTSVCDSLKSDSLKVNGGVDKDFSKDLLSLSKVLDSSGIDNDTKKKLIEQKISGGGLKDTDVSQILQNISTRAGEAVAERQNLNALEKALTSGDLQSVGITGNTVDKINNVNEALLAGGYSEKEVAKILSKASKGELGDKEIADIMSKVRAAGAKLPDTVIKTLDEVEKSLQASGGVLQEMKDMSEETIKNTLLLAKAMKKAGASDEEVKRVVAKATGDGLSEKETKELMAKLTKSPELTKKEKEELKAVDTALKQGKLRSCQVNDEAIKATVELQKTLMSADVGTKDIGKLLASIASKDMSEEEVMKAVKNFASKHGLDNSGCNKLLDAAKKVLDAGGINLPNVTSDNLENLAFLQKVLESSGASEEKIAETVAKAINQGLTKEEINDIITKGSGSKNLSKEDKAKLIDLQRSLQTNELKSSAAATGTTLEKAIAARKLLEKSGMTDNDIAQIINKVANGEKIDESALNSIVDKALVKSNMPKEEFQKVREVLKAINSGDMEVPGLTPELMDQVTLLKKTMEASGYSQDEISNVISKATGQTGLSDTATTELMARLMSSDKVSQEDKEKLQKVQKDLRDGSMRIGGSAEDLLAGLLSGSDPQILAKALLAQKVLSRSGMSQDDLAKVVMLQKGLMESGATADVISRALKDTLLKSAQGDGELLNAVLGQMEEDLKAAIAEGGENGSVNAADISGILNFEKSLGASKAAEMAMRKLPSKQKKLLEEIIKGEAKGEISGKKNYII